MNIDPALNNFGGGFLFAICLLFSMLILFFVIRDW